MQRVTDLTSKPVVGATYLVPTVAYKYMELYRLWPVFPSLHEDNEHFNFPWMHYHIDPRFLTPAQRRHIEFDDVFVAEARTQGTPLARHHEPVSRWAPRPTVEEAKSQIVPHGPIVWKPRRCMSDAVTYHHGHQDMMRAMAQSFAGQTCPKNKAGWVCPHKAYPLGSHAPDERGIITCPLHGLRIEAASGKVIPPADPPGPPAFGDALAARYENLPRDPITGRPVI